ncbi:hypothetical protein GCM10009800_28120 [Nocardiopsis rhodophaea]
MVVDGLLEFGELSGLKAEAEEGAGLPGLVSPEYHVLVAEFLQAILPSLLVLPRVVEAERFDEADS